MLSAEQLREVDILDWADLAKEFQGANLLLGNGFSIRIADSFKYDSIFDKFLNNCSSDYRSVFKNFETSNFESILQKLLDAEFVNDIFEIDEPRIREAINQIQNGLITTIREIHPTAEQIYWNRLQVIAKQFRIFSNIFTLNYDLFLYHIVMILKDAWEENEKLKGKIQYKKLWRYSDCFWKLYDNDFHTFHYYQDPNNWKFVYYLHGALFLFKESLDDLKLLRKDDGSELISRVADIINKGRMPLFVCEGTSERKMEQINSSNYLKFAYKKLKSSGDKFVVFGSSLSAQDHHIFTELDDNRNSLAISMHPVTKTRDELLKIQDQVRKSFTNASICFFNSDTLFKV